MDTKRLDFNLLVALEALLVERNVTKAALRLNLSQPALSAQLNRLRDLFGDQLLTPAQRGMIPTERALELQGPLNAALEQVRRVVADRNPFDPATADITVSIAASDYVQYAVLMPLTLELARKAPKLRIAWRPIDGRLIGDQLARGEVDLAVTTPDTAPEQLKSRKLYDERFVCIARRNHPLLRRSCDLDAFCSLPHVIVSPRGGGFTGATDAALAKLGRSRRVVLSVSSFLMVPEVVAGSELIAVVPERVVRDRSDRVKVFEPPLSIPGFNIANVWHERTDGQPAFRWLRQSIVENMSQSRAKPK
ncbi:LysR family transcriptional regulator [Bradyrhizobium elkanii]|uniref:LysR family transcriptional regulator n=1 Tax=Bradyrhizobium elkanii TaxID=29448 RepID=UPI0004BB2985|nr:LysR family transcriptional regulator [Bradyrhizobium elkanii]WLA83282.1 LysR family transcriptional regulator [Bradyrhizobium elkanii]